MAKVDKGWLDAALKDSAKFPDNVLVTLADGNQVELGVIRSLGADAQATLAKREKDLTDRQAQLNADLKTLSEAQTKTAELFAKLQAQDNGNTNRNTNVADPLDALSTDPALGVLATAIKAQRDAINKITEEIVKPVALSMRNMATAYVSDRTYDAYERYVPADKQGDYPLDKLLSVAEENGYKSKTGVPDIRRAYQHLTTKPMTQADLDAAIAKAKEEGRQEAAAAGAANPQSPFLPRPGTRAIISPVNKPAEGQFKTLDAALDAAYKDQEIWSIADGRTAS